MPVEKRLPCPERIVDMVGFAFGVGCIGGFGLTFVNSLGNFPKGHKISGAFAAAQTRAPVLGSTFAMWSGLFHCFECAISRRHANPDGARSSVDAAACGFLTAGLLSIRSGPKAAASSALMGAFCVGLVDVATGNVR
eukprot:TRINITY_DN6169_c1_g2_i1.p1 TRINITY_DN6169_c1_g2~~TRINITY_DN6169_c1_g2_i1.p1  ORF type:complete len:137 (-),score=19.51 TRINITY_DN6169_c1_g2_i1:90-500(-)